MAQLEVAYQIALLTEIERGIDEADEQVQISVQKLQREVTALCSIISQQNLEPLEWMDYEHVALNVARYIEDVVGKYQLTVFVREHKAQYLEPALNELVMFAEKHFRIRISADIRTDLHLFMLEPAQQALFFRLIFGICSHAAQHFPNADAVLSIEGTTKRVDLQFRFANDTQEMKFPTRVYEYASYLSPLNDVSSGSEIFRVVFTPIVAGQGQKQKSRTG